MLVKLFHSTLKFEEEETEFLASQWTSLLLPGYSAGDLPAFSQRFQTEERALRFIEAKITLEMASPCTSLLLQSKLIQWITILFSKISNQKAHSIGQ